MPPNQRNLPVNRRGAAVLEMIMVIPLLATIIGGIYFFGWSMMNQQHVRVSDRYQAWENTYGGGRTSDQINQYFLENRGTNVTVNYGSGQEDTVNDLVAAVGNFDQAAGALADGVLEKAPRGYVDAVSSEFPSTVGLWQKFSGAITDSSGREGVEWRRIQLNETTVVIDLYMKDVDTMANGIAEPGNGMGQMIRGLYMGGW